MLSWLGSILFAIVFGGVIGAVARAVLPGRQRIGIGMTIAIGIAGALVGTIVAALLGVRQTDGIDWIQWALQIGLAAIGVVLYERSQVAGRR